MSSFLLNFSSQFIKSAVLFLHNIFILNMFVDSEEGEYAMSSDFAEASESEEEGHRITTPRPIDGFY